MSNTSVSELPDALSHVAGPPAMVGDVQSVHRIRRQSC